MKSILTIILSFLLVVSGLAQTRNVVVGTNDVIVQPTNFWSANASNGRTGLGLGSAATNPASAFQPSSLVLSNLASSNGASLTNISVANVVGALATNGNAAGLTNITAANITGTLTIAQGGTSATNASTARQNLGLGAIWLTNTNVTNFRTDIGLGNSNVVSFGPMFLQEQGTYTLALGNTNTGFRIISGGASLYGFHKQGVLIWDIAATNDTFNVAVPMTFGQPATTRTNLGLGWPALTNTNAGTSLVSVNTNGEVVSPTNFWQVAPIQTLVQTFTPTTNSTNAATNARNLYVYSSATNVSGITNTITLPTNASTFNGDAATITHNGNTSSVTVIKQLGSATNFTTISNYAESVKFIREAGQWTFYHNISFVEPIRFADGSIEENKAASRTNLGIPLVALTNTSNATFQQAIFTTNGPTNIGNFGNHVAWMAVSIVTNGVTNEFSIPLYK